MKPILPKVGGEFSYAMGFVSNRVDGVPFLLEIVLKDFGLNNSAGYMLMVKKLSKILYLFFY